MTPAWQGEVMLLQWGESSTRGRTVTFLVGEDEDQHPFKTHAIRAGKRAGTRFMAVFVEIADDETAVDSKPTASQEAGRLCRDERFQEWTSVRYFVPRSEAGAREAVLQHCGVQSRATLDTNRRAWEAWSFGMKRDFEAWLAEELRAF